MSVKLSFDKEAIDWVIKSMKILNNPTKPCNSIGKILKVSILREQFLSGGTPGWSPLGTKYSIYKELHSAYWDYMLIFKRHLMDSIEYEVYKVTKGKGCVFIGSTLKEKTMGLHGVKTNKSHLPYSEAHVTGYIIEAGKNKYAVPARPWNRLTPKGETQSAQCLVDWIVNALAGKDHAPITGVEM